MSTLVQISDTHFGTEQPPVVDAAVELINRMSPDVVVLSGDITQRARIEQFRAAHRFIQRLQTNRVLVIPGNHDIPLFDVFSRAIRPYANYTECFGADLEPSFESDDLLIQCLNTTRPKRHKDGEVSAGQIERVSARLRSAMPNQLRIVVTHQPVHVIRPRDEKNLLHGHQAAVRAWSRAGADIIMGGHIHLPYVRPLSDRLKDLPRATWCVQAGTAVSCRVRGDIPNSLNVVTHERRSDCTVERWDYDAASLQFQPVEKHQLQLSE
ncbi:MAG TPA: metallophosphoesterase [Steroidobacteraceae bacterium]|nr:metallophosphoesterase [Steroidobacteraceae bacterium]